MIKLVGMGLVASALLLGQAVNAEEDVWQMNALFHPSPWQLEAERNGRVIIYHRLADTEVSRAMDTQFNRIQSMMFTSTVVTGDGGEPLRDEDTGEEVVEDDGCD